MANSLDLLSMLKEKINFGEDLMLRLEVVKKIDGVSKLQRKIRQEVEFLKRLQRNKMIKLEQLSCSNLRHLGAMVDRTLKPGVLAVCKIFHINDESKLLIDIISDEGKTWTKVIARNPKSLTALSTGKASYGSRSILDQAEDYLECAELYPCMYKSPKVIFEFTSGIEQSLANKLKVIGVHVQGDILPDSHTGDDCNDSSESTSSDEELMCNNSDENNFEDVPPQCIQGHSELTTLNLDVTAMMAYISNMTNGHCNYIFKQDVLTQQSAWEAERPVKPILDRLFEGKTLVCCKTAWDDFETIVENLGGTMEKKRASNLKKIVTIFPDDHNGPNDISRQNLKVRGHVRLRSKIIFNFGHRIKALTVSANEGFLRAALQQVNNISFTRHLFSWFGIT
ncbi:unnamed protein product [Diatraea saccharalis]|uniref:DUF1308 domain-containing protein n=1 Tax=Diatraea saccharalis TaxID=40085 RepID=A0A9N9RFP8_9NEOP|nr:unnamed protein product [Diatraea saccharalis]